VSTPSDRCSPRPSTACTAARAGESSLTLIRQFGDFDLAEEALQDAYEKAITAWRDGGHAGQRRRLADRGRP
jgi:predicted RNA polymerase sigma factor